MKSVIRIALALFITSLSALAQTTCIGCPVSAGGGASGSYSAPSATYSGTIYLPPGGGVTASSTEALVQGKAPVAGSVANLTANVGTAPGSGNSLTFTWRKNATDQSVTCAITNTNTSCADTTHSFTVAAGDLLDVKVVSSGSPSATTLVLQWGLPGAQGPAGASGAAGAAATVAVGTVTTGSAGSSATVSNSGTSGAAVLDFTIPRGATGSTGATGATGPQGPAGSGNNTYCADATGSTTTYTCPTPTPVPTTLNGLMVAFKPQTTNTGSSTLNVASLGAKTLKAADGSTNMAAGDLVGGRAYIFAYDGTNFVQVSSNGGGSGTITGCAAGSTYGGLTCTVVGNNVVPDVNPAVTPGKNRAETIAALWAFNHIQIPTGTIAAGGSQLPAASTVPDQWYWASDGASTCDTSTGGGSTRVLLQSDGTNWKAPNCNTSSSGGQTLTSGLLTCFYDYPCHSTLGTVGAGQMFNAGQSALQLVGFKVANHYTAQTIKRIVLLSYSGTAKVNMGIYNPSGTLLGQAATISEGNGAYNPDAFVFSTPVVVNTPWFWVVVAYEATGSGFTVFANSTTATALTSITQEGMVYTFGAPNAGQTGGIGTDIAMPNSLGTSTIVTGASAAALPIAFKVTD